MAVRLIYDKNYKLGINVAAPSSEVDILGTITSVSTLGVTGVAAQSVPTVSISQGASATAAGFGLKIRGGATAPVGPVVVVAGGLATPNAANTLQEWQISTGVRHAYVDNAGVIYGWDSTLATPATSEVVTLSKTQIITGAKTFTRASASPPFTVGTAYATGATVTNLSADLLDGQDGLYYAQDSLIVHKAGTETITGVKTFDTGAAPVFTPGFTVGANSVQTAIAIAADPGFKWTRTNWNGQFLPGTYQGIGDHTQWKQTGLAPDLPIMVLGPSGELYLQETLKDKDWLPNTTYAVGQQCRSDFPLRVYTCTVGGVSASSGYGPTGITSSIVDGTGTLRWDYTVPFPDVVMARVLTKENILRCASGLVEWIKVGDSSKKGDPAQLVITRLPAQTEDTLLVQSVETTTETWVPSFYYEVDALVLALIGAETTCSAFTLTTSVGISGATPPTWARSAHIADGTCDWSFVETPVDATYARISSDGHTSITNLLAGHVTVVGDGNDQSRVIIATPPGQSLDALTVYGVNAGALNWAPSTFYAAASTVFVLKGQTDAYDQVTYGIYINSQDGTSGTVKPFWSPTDPVVDGGCLWTIVVSSALDLRTAKISPLGVATFASLTLNGVATIAPTTATAPFILNSDAAVVTYLDADKLDGYHAASFALDTNTMHLTGNESVDDVKTFSHAQVFNGGIDLGTSGRIDSQVADAVGAYSVLVKPTVAQTAGDDHFLFGVQNSAGQAFVKIGSNGHIGLWSGSLAYGAIVQVMGNALSTDYIGINLSPTWTGAGGSMGGFANAVAGGNFIPFDSSGATATTLIGGIFSNQIVAARAHSNIIGAYFKATYSLSIGAFAHGNLYGFYVAGNSSAKASTATAAYGGYIADQLTGVTPATPSSYGLYIEAQTRGATLNSSIWCAGAGKIHFNQTTEYISSKNANYLDLDAATSIRANATLDVSAKNIATDTTTGTQIGTAAAQKLSLWGVTPVIQPAATLQAAVTNSTGGSQDGTLVDVTTLTLADPAKCNDNFTDLYALVDAMRTALVAAGIMKGAA